MSTDTKEPGAPLLGSTNLDKTFSSLAENEGDAGERLDVVDNRGALEETLDGREGRL